MPLCCHKAGLCLWLVGFMLQMPSFLCVLMGKLEKFGLTYKIDINLCGTICITALRLDNEKISWMCHFVGLTSVWMASAPHPLMTNNDLLVAYSTSHLFDQRKKEWPESLQLAFWITSPGYFSSSPQSEFSSAEGIWKSQSSSKPSAQALFFKVNH